MFFSFLFFFFFFFYTWQKYWMIFFGRLFVYWQTIPTLALLWWLLIEKLANQLDQCFLIWPLKYDKFLLNISYGIIVLGSFEALDLIIEVQHNLMILCAFTAWFSILRYESIMLDFLYICRICQIWLQSRMQTFLMWMLYFVVCRMEPLRFLLFPSS